MDYEKDYKRLSGFSVIGSILYNTPIKMTLFSPDFLQNDLVDLSLLSHFIVFLEVDLVVLEVILEVDYGK